MAPRPSHRPREAKEGGAKRHHHSSGHKKKKSSGKKSSSREDKKSASSSQPAPLSIDALNRLNARNMGGQPHWHNEEYKSKGQIRKDREAQKRREKEAQKAAVKEAERQAAQRAAQKKRQDRHKRKASAAAAAQARYQSDDDVYQVENDDDGYGDDGYARVRAGGTHDRQHRRKRDRRIPSGAILEEGLSPGHMRGGAGTHGSSDSSRQSIEKEELYYTKTRKPRKKRTSKKCLWICGGLIALVVLIVIIVVAVVVSKKNSDKSSSSSSSSSLDSISPSSIPSGAPTWLNPYDWKDTTDFNLTYTDETVGGLPVMGLYTDYDDSQAANSDRPAISDDWGSYATTPARGVNLGGWLSLEPFITPSLFKVSGVIDEYTLCSYLGSSCASTLEEHYASFVTEDTFKEIAAAGLDHVRIPFSYWAVEVYDGDPYLYRTSWRYLLRGIEWARKYGLRVNLDLHGLPGSQNGWNHSGRQGTIGWMNGTDGDLNVQRSVDVHDKLSKFFAQARYKNVISHYGLANEPRMTFLSMSGVMNWTQTTAALVRKNGVSNKTAIVFGDGFCGLDKWQGQPNTQNLVLDVHQYEIFNNEQIVYTHEEKIKYACSGWTEQTEESMDTSTGFGPTIVAEWSQADTDCAEYLGNVGNGARWTGNYDVGNDTLNALTPKCPAQNSSCQCTDANADPSQYNSQYKQFLLTFAEAQMYSFEKGWGWWYWTWDTETATQWSYKKGLAAGILPAKAGTRDFQCDLTNIPSISGLSEFY